MLGTSSARLRSAGGGRLIAHVISVVFAAATTALAAGCATAGGAAGGQWSSSSSEGASGLLIENHSWDLITVYISRGGQLLRVGEVAALSDIRFPARLLGAAVGDGRAFLIARVTAGGAFRSEPFLVPSGGGTVVWTIENQLGLSHVVVR